MMPESLNTVYWLVFSCGEADQLEPVLFFSEDHAQRHADAVKARNPLITHSRLFRRSYRGMQPLYHMQERELSGVWLSLVGAGVRQAIADLAKIRNARPDQLAVGLKASFYLVNGTVGVSE